MKRKLLPLLIVVALIVSLFPVGAFAASTSALTTETPWVVVTGAGVSGKTYTAASVKNEKSYTLSELKAIANADKSAKTNNQYVYSSLNSRSSARFYLAEGVRLSALLSKSGVSNPDSQLIKVVATDDDSFSVTFNPDKTADDGSRAMAKFGTTRNYYPNVGQAENKDSGAVAVDTILAWASSYNAVTDANDPAAVTPPTSAKPLTDIPTLYVGQYTLNTMNNPCFNGNAGIVQVGSPISATALTVGSSKYTRAQLLAMPRARKKYGSIWAKGVPLSELLKDADKNSKVSFRTVKTGAGLIKLYGDDTEPILIDKITVGGSGSMTVQQLIDRNYMAAYEEGTATSNIAGIYAIPVESVTLSKTTLSLAVGKTATLKAKIAPSKATDTSVTWTSSDAKIAKVDKNGVVKGVGPGKAKITATSNNGKKQTCTVTVTMPVKSVKLDKTKLTLNKGKTAILKATLAPTNASNTKVTWKSSNEKIATVSNKGVVKAVGKGTATITVTTEDGKKTSKCTVTVK